MSFFIGISNAIPLCIFISFSLAVPLEAYRIHSALSRSFWQEEEDVNLLLWTWNSGQADLSEEAKRLGKTNADVIVTCQTEAQKAIHNFMSEEWLLVAHGEHWGAAGRSINAQMSSVFVRRPLDGSELLGNVSEIIGLKPWRSDAARSEWFRRVKSGETPSLALQAFAQVTATDYKGKGGVSTILHLPLTQVRDGMRLQFVCAHLDSETVEARHYGIAQLLAEARSMDDQTATVLRKETASKSGEIRRPCAIFDRRFLSCKVDKDKELHLKEMPDAVMLFGDLNYRLSAFNIQNISEVFLLTHDGREMLAENDPLSRLKPVSGRSKTLDVLVQKYQEGGFGFECNEPFEFYPPTYKRKGGKVRLVRTVEFSETWRAEVKTLTGEAVAQYVGDNYFELQNSTGSMLDWHNLDDVQENQFPLKFVEEVEACTKLGEVMRTCGRRLQKHCPEWAEQLLSACYVRKDKKGVIQWARKKNDIQLGWLDRFCWRKANPKSRVQVTLRTDEGWENTAGSKAKKGLGSDHMPIAAKFTLTTMTCGCWSDLQDDNMVVDSCQDTRKERLQNIASGDTVPARCRTGYGLPNGQEEVLLACRRDGTLAPHDGKLKCKKVCKENYPQGASLPFVRSAHQMLSGDLGQVSCADPEAQLLGNPAIECGKDGILHPVEKDDFPHCARACVLPAQRNIVLKEKVLANSWLMFAYGREIKARANLNGAILEGGYARYSCRNECISVGSTERYCHRNHSTPFARVKCACFVKLTVKEITFKDPEVEKQVEKVKFQLYRGPLQEEKLEDLRGHKGYASSTKFTLQELQRKINKPVVSVEKPANVELHVTLCSENGRRTNALAFWRCGVLADTSAGSLTVQELLSDVDENDGEKTVDLTLDMAVGKERRTTNVAVKLAFRTGSKWSSNDT